ncbi:MAG: hypothetical protein D6744_02960 [Planctomycetota bacterium]|nr:MAG: hypothetical protein D6744_02960 [Planctomycetota bacterium]
MELLTMKPRANVSRAARLWILLTAGVAFGAGCQAPQLRGPAAEAPIPTDTNAELCEYISNLPFVTNEACLRAVHVLKYGDVFPGAFGELRAKLSGDGVPVPEGPAAQFLTRADVGKIVATACGVRSGLNWRLTGLGRYAWRELQYKRIARISGEYGLVSGGEFLGVLARAEEYMFEHGEISERAELGEEPGS